MKRLVLPLLALLAVSGCSHRYYAEDLKSLSEADQGANKTVADLKGMVGMGLVLLLLHRRG